MLLDCAVGAEVGVTIDASAYAARISATPPHVTAIVAASVTSNAYVALRIVAIVPGR